MLYNQTGTRISSAIEHTSTRGVEIRDWEKRGKAVAQDKGVGGIK